MVPHLDDRLNGIVIAELVLGAQGCRGRRRVLVISKGGTLLVGTLSMLFVVCVLDLLEQKFDFGGQQDLVLFLALAEELQETVRLLEDNVAELLLLAI